MRGPVPGTPADAPLAALSGRVYSRGMTQNSTAAAHIVTGEARLNPSIVVVAGGTAPRIAELIPLDGAATLTDALDRLERYGYRLPYPPTEVETGYWVIDAVRR